MGKLIQVRLGEHRPVIYVDDRDVECKRGDYLIVEVERGVEFSRVASRCVPKCESEKKFFASGRVIRKATDTDLRQIEHNRTKAKDALHVCIAKINELKLEMNMLMSEYAFDGSKIIFYFTAEGRVDFRDLVKELAKLFRVRIELKQIGVRDRAKMVEGYGVCGQHLCCASFIKDFSQLSIKMAKEQALPLNPSKISGVCGRIKCCMAYEYNVYKELNKGLPKMGGKMQTADGKGKVINLDILKRLVHLDMGDGKIVKMNIPKTDDVPNDKK
ncbi:MAG: regulatory iron-sulfur-containing complex subunit RicT [Candidatus Omnitrophota bacterium]